MLPRHRHCLHDVTRRDARDATRNDATRQTTVRHTHARVCMYVRTCAVPSARSATTRVGMPHPLMRGQSWACFFIPILARQIDQMKSMVEAGKIVVAYKGSLFDVSDFSGHCSAHRTATPCAASRTVRHHTASTLHRSKAMRCTMPCVHVRL